MKIDDKDFQFRNLGTNNQFYQVKKLISLSVNKGLQSLDIKSIKRF